MCMDTIFNGEKNSIAYWNDRLLYWELKNNWMTSGLYQPCNAHLGVLYVHGTEDKPLKLVTTSEFILAWNVPSWAQKRVVGG